MAKINILTPDIYNKISAGEVVESPVGAVKELVENSVDAGANRIVVEVENGGFGLISVSDNGCGIDEDQIEAAFLKHATSKIAVIDDLYDVETLGFRGEALSSISAVSHVKLTTKTENAPYAVCVEIENGKTATKDYTAAVTGTKIEVRDLFFNTPARRKFFKTPQKEGVEITKYMAKFILTNPHVEVRYVCDGTTVYDCAGRGLECAMFAVYGHDCVANCVKVDERRDNVEVHGYIGTPDYAKANRTYQVFSVNGRNVYDQRLSAVIGQAYKPYLMTRKYPFFVLNVVVPADEVDVNVHPKKSEVRFAKPDTVYNLCYRAVDNALQRFIREKTSELIAATSGVGVQADDFAGFDGATTFAGEQNNAQNQTTTDAATAKYFAQNGISMPDEQQNGNSASGAKDIFRQGSFTDAEYMNRDEGNDVREIERQTEEFDKARDFDKFADELGKELTVENARKMLWGNGERNSDGITIACPQPQQTDGTSAPVREEVDPNEVQMQLLYDRARILGVAFKTYLIIELDEKVIFVDQHAAHERILFEKFKQGAFNDNKQPLLFPYVFTVKADEAQFIEDNIDNIYKAGVEVERFGANTFRITAVSSLLANTQMNKFVEFLLSEMEEFRVDDNTLRIERLAQMACKAAVKAGQTLNEYEIKYILNTIVEGNLMQCPHGRPITVMYTRTQIDKWFKRIVT